MARFDVFISHASEDKLDVARPLASLLLQAGLTVWLDEAELVIGDSLRRKIDQGLASSRHGVVILSKAFFAKEWPQKELDALVAREGDSTSVILPVWHNISAKDIVAFSPILADRLSVRTDRGLQSVAASILQASRRIKIY
jgi:TIR domain